MHPLARLAKETVELYITKKKVHQVRDEDFEPEFREPAGVFVCLKTAGMLRGCIGTFQPTEPSIVRETVRNAVSAATCDPRFACVRPGELGSLDYTVDVLTPPEPVSTAADLDPKRYGLIVQAGARRGLLLPDLEGVDTVDEQVAIAMRKAGIPPGATVTLFRFEVKRYH